jgi:hypothetical protein
MTFNRMTLGRMTLGESLISNIIKPGRMTLLLDIYQNDIKMNGNQRNVAA